jgi:phenylacetate-coenzyme A ligase PaaK-like adenylate-forming protein
MSVLELPYGRSPDPDELVQAAMAWHFEPETGTEFWVERAKTLDFDPRTDVKTHADLAMFPNVTDELRNVPVRKLVPRGYGPEPEIVSVIESGGTTGAPKALPLMADFAQLMVGRDLASLERAGLPHDKDWLAMAPSGPHGAFEQARRAARAWGALCFGIDMDPRWVKKQISAGHAKEADAYAEHLLDQVTFILRNQNIGYLRCTPPMLARLVARDELVDLVRSSVELLTWGGASMDADSRDFYQRDVFPGITISGGFGTTMALGSGGSQRLGDTDETIFDPNLSPYTTFEVRNTETGRSVAYGERGQLVVHHVSKALLLPNNAERDEVTRIAPVNGGQVGDSIADISPLRVFEGTEVIEGVY